MATNFPTSLDSYTTKVDNTDDVSAADINDPQDAIEALEAKVGIDSSAATTSLDYKVNNFFATGRKLYLYENTAPTGWSIESVTDKVLAVKGGSNAYNITGGNTGGTWEQPDHNHQWYEYIFDAHNQSFGSDGLAESISTSNRTYRGIYFPYTTVEKITEDLWTDNNATATTWRPIACVGIIVTKT